MRKFKFASKVVVGMLAAAMTMGSFSGVAAMKPIGVYAETPIVADSENFEISVVPPENAAEDYEPSGVRGEKIQLQLTAFDQKTLPEGATYAWTSSAESVATVVADNTDSTKATVTILDNAAINAEFTITATATYTVNTEEKKEKATYSLTVDISTFSLSAENGATTVKPNSKLTFTSSYTLGDNEIIIYEAGTSEDLNAGWTEIPGVSFEDPSVGVLTVGADVPKDTKIQVGATVYEKNAEGKPDEEKCVAIAEELFITVTDETPAPSGSFKVEGPDYETMTITVTSSAPYVVLEVIKDKTKTPVKLSGTYTYQVPSSGPNKNKVVIDLGFINLKKDAEIYVYESTSTTEKNYADTNTTNLFKLKKQPGKLKLKANTSAASFLEAIKENAKEGSESLTIDATVMTKLEYRSQYGDTWESLDKFPYETAKVSGTTIYVRRGADGQPAGPETKLKISAATKAPTVKVNYDKDTVGVKKSGQAMAILGASAPAAADFATPSANNLEIDQIIKECIKQTTGSEATAAQVAAYRASGFTLVVITKKAGKADSIPQLIPIKPQGTFDASTTADIATYNGVSVKLVAGSKDGKVKLEGANASSFEYQDKNGKWKKASNKDLDPVDNGLTVRYAGSKEAGKEAFPTAAKKLTVAPEDVKKATIEVAATDATLFVEGANATADFSLPLTITVKDADGKAVTDATVAVSSVKKGTADVSNVTLNGTNLVFNAANATDESKQGPTLTADETYVITFTCTVGEETATGTLELKVAEKQQESPEAPVATKIVVTEANGTATTATVTKPTGSNTETVTLSAKVTDADDKEIQDAEVVYTLDDASKTDEAVTIADNVVTIGSSATVTTVTVTATVKDTEVKTDFVITIQDGSSQGA